MIVRHEPPLADLSFSVKSPLWLEFKGSKRIAELESWNLEQVESFDLADEEHEGILNIPFQGVSIKFPVKLVPSGDPGFFNFKDLNSRQFETLKLFHQSIASGKMVSTDEMIMSLDRPVDLIPMEQADADAAPDRSSRLRRLFWFVFLYLLLALAVIGLVGPAIFRSATTFQLNSGTVVAPFLDHAAAEPSFVQSILVNPGDTVAQGQILIHMNSPERDAALEDVRLEITRAERRVKEIKDQIRQRQRLVKRTRRELSQRYLRALEVIIPGELFGGYKLEELRAARRAIENFENALRRDRIDQTDTQILEERERELRRLKRELGHTKLGMDALHVRASQAGTVDEVLVYEGQFVRPGEVALRVEENSPRIVKSWISNDKIASVHLGMPVTVVHYARQGRVQLPGEISQISNDLDASLPDGTATMVTVSLAASNDLSDLRQLPHGTPVHITVRRQLWRTGAQDR